MPTRSHCKDVWGLLTVYLALCSYMGSLILDWKVGDHEPLATPGLPPLYYNMLVDVDVYSTMPVYHKYSYRTGPILTAVHDLVPEDIYVPGPLTATKLPCNEALDYSVANREKPYFILGRYA
ncbi:hypothetical protein NDU88_002594 [Pleurodeles waltl]|uniref:Uncharacterized protein n=1 Tax=Pleurodeles waltl TaxID=8319 RepID=A0AAV7UW23_PLEWA|nr:hypothetical protein NDU88_002594 [Pleurodeles waltl]